MGIKSWPASADGQTVGYQETHRPVFLGQDQGAQIMGFIGRRTHVEITPQPGGLGQVPMQLLGILDFPDPVIIISGEGPGISSRDGDILAEKVGIGRS